MNKRIFLITDWIAFVLVPLLLGVIYFNGNTHLYKERGSISLNLLYLIMFMKPIIVILGNRNLYQMMPYRRQLGVIATWLAIFHTIGLMIAKDLRNISAYFSNPLSNYLFIGLLAIIGMIVLGLTSNFFSIKLLGNNWKRIQWLAYPTLFLSKLHADLSHGLSRGSFKTLTTSSSSISMNKILPTGILLIIFIGLKYRQHKIQTKEWKSLSEM